MLNKLWFTVTAVKNDLYLMKMDFSKMFFLKNAYDAIVKKLYGKFNGKFFTYVSVPGSYIALFFLLLKKKKKQIIILPANAIGDCLYTFSFLEVLNRHVLQDHFQMVIYVSDRYKKILETYPVSLSNVVYLKHLGIKHLLLLMLSTSSLAPKSVIIAAQNYIYASYPMSYGRYIPKEIIGARNKLSYALRVPTNPILYHNLPKSNISAIKNFETGKERICIVNPYSSSMIFSGRLYKKICEMLKRKGFLVYTNVCGSQKAIEGTNPLHCSLEELYSIACDIPLIVSVRSGILDFLIPSGVNMFVIYETWKDKHNMVDPKVFATHYSLKEWLPKGMIQEIYMGAKSENEKILAELCSFLGKLGI